MNSYRKLGVVILTMMLLIACDKDDDPIQENTAGKNMVLIGNSFFRPYAEKLDVMAIEAGFENHNSTTVFRGGDNGRPINFWNDSSSSEHNSIKAALDQGNVDFLGMTAGKLPDNPTDGFKEWIAYALQDNPDITIFLSIPPFDFPQDWDQLVQDNGFDTVQELYDYFVNEMIHKTLVDPLRAEFPTTNIFTIPTGWASIHLAQMKLDNELMDDLSLFGLQETSVFTDEKGHQGDIIRETGGLIWLNSLYDVDLNTFSYETGFNTDLHDLALQIMNEHDSNYKK